MLEYIHNKRGKQTPSKGYTMAKSPRLHFVINNNGIFSVHKAKTPEGLAILLKKYTDLGMAPRVVSNPPGLATLQRYMDNGVAKTPDGRRVEPDHPESWLSLLGMI